MSCTRKLVVHPTDIVNLRLYFFISEPPSAPQNVTVIFVDQSTVILGWLPPEKSGGRGDTVYRIKCDVCSLGLVQYHPNYVSMKRGLLRNHN